MAYKPLCIAEDVFLACAEGWRFCSVDMVKRYFSHVELFSC